MVSPRSLASAINTVSRTSSVGHGASSPNKVPCVDALAAATIAALKGATPKASLASGGKGSIPLAVCVGLIRTTTGN